MCHVFDNLLVKGVVTKVVDDLYCGWNTPKNLQNRQKVLQAVRKCDLCLSVLKNVINPCRNPMFATEGGNKESLRCAELQTSFIT